jgi:phosphotransferase system  glucose/maltose/N-acetylglucosamine-specific IIC component
MNPRYRAAILLVTIFAIMAPFMGFVMYVVFRFPNGHWPGWVGNTMLAWFATNFFLAYLLVRRTFKKQPGGSEKSSPLPKALLVPGSYLVILWCGLFIYGLNETIHRRIPLSRALPVGLFLLLFIGFFGWGIYQQLRRKASN